MHATGNDEASANSQSSARRPQSVTLRQMTPADVDDGLRLCRLSHWNQVARDWERFLASHEDAARVAVDTDGRVVGSVAAIRYTAAPTPAGARTLAWLAMVLVDPEVRGRGIGRSLLEGGLASVADVTTVGLDATPLGQPLYETLGFRTDAALTRMARARPQAGAAQEDMPGPAEVRPIRREDLARIARLDAQATGLDRAAMLTWLWEGAPELAWVTGDDAGGHGFVLGRHGHAADHLGPIVAASAEIAAQLLHTCLPACTEARVLVDIVDAQPGWQGVLEGLGFTAQRPFARMYRGDWRPSSNRSLLFAPIGPEFG